MPMATVTLLRPVRKLLPFLPDSDFSRLIAEGFALARAQPRILEMIDRDRDAFALVKKQARRGDQAWLISRGLPLPGLDGDVDVRLADNAELATGRPRMLAVLV